jgi:hypothetical protein
MHWKIILKILLKLALKKKMNIVLAPFKDQLIKEQVMLKLSFKENNL